jgi:Cu-processing system permease protein
VRGMRAVAAHALREARRRRVIRVVLTLTTVFLALYALGASFAFDAAEELGFDEEGLPEDGLPEDRVVTGSTLLGLASFATLFLGAIVASFLSIGTVKTDAEAGVLQSLAVRPIGRSALLATRIAVACGISAAYAIAVFGIAILITGVTGDWWPDRIVGPLLGLGLGVSIVAAIGTLGSVFMSATANGVAVLMVFGTGLTAGLLGQIGNGLDVETLESIGQIGSWALPFEALYQSGLSALTADQSGLTDVVVELGPFGGAQDASVGLWFWAVGYLLAVSGLAIAAFRRLDI